MNKTATKPTDAPTSKKKPVAPDPDHSAVYLQQVKLLLEPLTDFHKSADDLTSDDLRMYWDVRIVRGASTAFAHVQGTSSMPQMLAPKMIALAPNAIQIEIQEKIIRPLIAVLQTEAENGALEAWKKSADKAGFEGEIEEP